MYCLPITISLNSQSSVISDFSHSISVWSDNSLSSGTYHIAGNFWGRKLLRISWFCGLKVSPQSLGAWCPLWHGTSKQFSVKIIFFLESFPLYSNNILLVTCKLGKVQQRKITNSSPGYHRTSRLTYVPGYHRTSRLTYVPRLPPHLQAHVYVSSHSHKTCRTCMGRMLSLAAMNINKTQEVYAEVSSYYTSQLSACVHLPNVM